MKETAISGPYLNDYILNSCRGFGMIYPQLYKNFTQKIVARSIVRIWYLRVQKTKQNKLAYLWGMTIQLIESIYKEWRLKGGI